MKKIIFSLLFMSSIMHAMELPDHDNKDKTYRGSSKSFVERFVNLSPMTKENYIAAAIAGGVALADVVYFKSGDLYFYAGLEVLISLFNNSIIKSQHELLTKIKSAKRADIPSLKKEIEKSSDLFTKSWFIQAGVRSTGFIFSKYFNRPELVNDQNTQRWVIAAGLGVHYFTNLIYMFKKQNEIETAIK